MTKDEESLMPLITWAMEVRPKDIPNAVYDHASVVLMDLLAVIWAGRSEPEVQGLGLWAKKNGVLNDSRWVGLLLGTAAVTSELDEGNRRAMGHPGSHIAPAMLAAIPQLEDLTIQDVVFAFVVAYEVSARIASAGTPRSGSHPHGTWGTIGGAVALGLLRGETSQLIRVVQLASSMGLATAFSAPQEGRTVRNLYAGLSASLAFLAFEWAEVVSGIFAPTETLFVTWSDTGILDGLGSKFAISENYMKTIAACRYVHGAVQAVEVLVKRYDLTADDIEAVEVETYMPAALLSGLPSNTLSSKFSLPYAVLRAVQGKGHDLAAFHEPLGLSSQDLELMHRIHVCPSDEMTKLLPDIRKTRVTIYRRFTNSPINQDIDLPLGEWDAPFDEGELAIKWKTLLKDYPDNMAPRTLSIQNLGRFVTHFIGAF